MNQSKFYLFTFKSRTDAVSFSGEITGRGLSCSVRATPSAIARGGCGLSVVVDYYGYEVGISVLREGRFATFAGAKIVKLVRTVLLKSIILMGDVMLFLCINKMTSILPIE